MENKNNIQVLDKGFVRLVDHMGDDSSIVQAARVSYGKGTKSAREDAALIDYLIRHKHDSPLEMPVFRFHIKMPIFVARQWCLGGSSRLHFVNGYNNEYKRELTVKKAFEIFNSKNKNKLLKRKLRCLNTKTNEVEYTHIKDIWIVGEKPVYKITIKTNQQTNNLFCTDDHPILTENGWKELKEFCKLPTKDNNNNFESSLKISTVVPMWEVENKIIPTLLEQDYSNEMWTDVKDFNLYECSNFGRIRNKNNKKLKHLFVDKHERVDYPRLKVTLQINNSSKMKKMSVSRIIFSSFNKNVDVQKLIVRHLDGNVWNNELNNLILGTTKDNYQDSVLHKSNAILKTKHRLLDILNIEYCGVETVYDIEVSNEEHNFVCDGVVVHNCRHRTHSMNEVSLRYSEVTDDFYIPSEWRQQSTTNKQGSSEVSEFEFEDHLIFSEELQAICNIAFQRYENLIKNNVTREQARILLPINLYTEFYWQQNLRNLLHLLKLRLDPHAQWEIRQYAQAMFSLVQPIVPKTVASWENHVNQAITLSRDEQEIIGYILKTGSYSVNDMTEWVSASRLKELQTKFNTLLQNSSNI